MKHPTYTSIPYDQLNHPFKSTTTELSSSSLSSRVISYSDDFFASVHNLLKPGPSNSLAGQFGEKGALYDGWESRRHNVDHDWAIIKLGPQLSTILGFDIDTSHFNGNEGPEANVWGLRVDVGDEGVQGGGGKIRKDDKRWEMLLPNVPLGPNSHHLFKIEDNNKVYSHVKLCMIPDGGIARFRVYGRPLPPPPTTPPTLTDLASSLSGGILVSTSNQHYGIASNLLLPGRGVDMGDGWETRRSRKVGWREWAVVRLGAPGWLDHVEIDTAFHMGNPPMFAELHAINSAENVPSSDDEGWTCILSKKATGPHRQHFYPVENGRGKVFTHVRLTIYPDGGLKRIRIMGYRADGVSAIPHSHRPITTPEIEALPLTYEAFLPYGQVAQAYSVPTAAPKGIRKSEVNQGTACKYHKMVDIVNSYPAGRGKTGISVVRAGPQIGTGQTIDVRVLERHKHSSQIFIPMGKAKSLGEEALEDGGAYVAIVALSDADDRPDMSTLRAFLVTSSQGVSYAPGVWHHPLLTAESTLDYACIETSPTQDSQIETEFVGPNEQPLARVIVPKYSGKIGLTSQLQIPSQPKTGLGLFSNGNNDHSNGNGRSHSIPCRPLTANAFQRFGQVIQAYGNEPPKHVKVDIDEKFKLKKFLDLAPVKESYPQGAGATTAVSVFRCTVKQGMEKGKQWPIHLMERHPYTEQTFIPMGTATWEGKGEEPLQSGAAYIVIVAEAGEDGRPDPSTLQAFLASASQGVNYTQGVWHHPMLTLGGTIDFACVETQTGEDGEEMDCELLEFKKAVGIVDVPAC